VHSNALATSLLARRANLHQNALLTGSLKQLESSWSSIFMSCAVDQEDMSHGKVIYCHTLKRQLIHESCAFSAIALAAATVY
jgi:hypothetical protein